MRRKFPALAIPAFPRTLLFSAVVQILIRYIQYLKLVLSGSCRASSAIGRWFSESVRTRYFAYIVKERMNGQGFQVAEV